MKNRRIMKETRIIDRNQYTPSEKAELTKENPYYRYLEEKTAKANLRLMAAGLTKEQIKERQELMLLLAKTDIEKEIIRNASNS